MIFPDLKTFDYSQARLVETYANYVATETIDRLQVESSATSVQEEASRAIGHSCITLSSDPIDLDQFDAQLKTAEDWFELVPGWSTGRSNEAWMTKNTIVPLLKSVAETDSKQTAVMTARENVHGRIIQELAAFDTMLTYPLIRDKDAPDTLGIVSHLTALALFTRLRHPQLLAMSSLPHQNSHSDTSLRHQNYDILLVEAPVTAPDRPDITPDHVIHKIQVKTACLGYCAGPETQPRDSTARINIARRAKQKRESLLQYQLKERERYAPDIALVSGCCDLGVRGRQTDILRPVTGLLISELAGELSDDEIRWLDTVSNSLMMVVTGDEDRRGTFSSQ